MIFIEHMTPLTREEVEGKLDILREAIVSTEGRGAKSGHRDAVLAAIKATVPTYRTPEEVNSEGIKGA